MRISAFLSTTARGCRRIFCGALLGLLLWGAWGAALGAELRVLTWNVLAEPPPWEERFARWLQVLEQANPDVVALQEVEPKLLSLWGQSPRSADFRLIAERDPRGGIRGGLAILTRLTPVFQRFTALPSDLGRGLLELELPLGALRLHLANLHLESGRGNTQRRLAQMAKIQSHLAGYEHLLWLGDFNFGDADPEQQRLPSGYRDLWSWLRPGEAGLTYDRAQNPWPIATASGSSPAAASTASCCALSGSHRWWWNGWAWPSIPSRGIRLRTTMGCWRCCGCPTEALRAPGRAGYLHWEFLLGLSIYRFVENQHRPMSTQISAHISDETKAQLEAFVRRRGITRARLI